MFAFYGKLIFFSFFAPGIEIAAYATANADHLNMARHYVKIVIGFLCIV